MIDETMTVTIDDRKYDVNTLNEEAKQQILNLRITDQEITHLRHQLAIATTARAAYAAALTAELSKMDTNKH